MVLAKYIRAIGAPIYASIVWSVFLVFLHCIPGSSIPRSDFFEFTFFDKFVHFVLFGVFVLLWSIHLMNKPQRASTLEGTLWRITLTGILLGVFLEWIQITFIPLRSFEWGDIAVDVAGLVTVAGVFWKFGERLGLFDK